MKDTYTYQRMPGDSSYEKCKKSIADSISDLTPSGKLFKLTSMLHKCEIVESKRIPEILSRMQLSNACKDLIKELTDDLHLQPKP